MQNILDSAKSCFFTEIKYIQDIRNERHKEHRWSLLIFRSYVRLLDTIILIYAINYVNSAIVVK